MQSYPKYLNCYQAFIVTSPVLVHASGILGGCHSLAVVEFFEQNALECPPWAFAYSECFSAVLTAFGEVQGGRGYWPSSSPNSLAEGPFDLELVCMQKSKAKDFASELNSIPVNLEEATELVTNWRMPYSPVEAFLSILAMREIIMRGALALPNYDDWYLVLGRPVGLED